MTKGRKTLRERVISVLCVTLVLIGALYISNCFEWLGIYLTIVPYCSLMLMLVLILSFLIFSAKGTTTKQSLPWYDVIFILMSVISTGYITFFPHRWTPLLEGGTTTLLEQSLCFLLVFSIIEATRRTINLAMAIIAFIFTIHLIFGSHFPGILVTPDFSMERIASVFYLRAEGIFGVPVIIAMTVLLAFMVLSAFLQNSDAGRFILDGAISLTGYWKGGPAKAAVLGSALLGTMVGSTAANVATTGSITIPLMKKTGYSPEFAGGVEAVASNGGQIMPPVMGAVAFLISELLGKPYMEVCINALFPAILYFVAIFVQVHLEAVKLGLEGIPSGELPRIQKVLRDGWFYLVPIAILLYMLTIMRWPIEHSGLYSSIATMLVIIIAWQTKKETRKSFRDIVAWIVQSFEIAAKSLLVPAIACASAGIIIGSLETSGIGFRLSSILVDASGGNLFFLLALTAAASFILGMGMTSIPCYMVLVILVAPSLIQLGIEPIAAHLFVFYWGLVSFITPPVAVAAYVACGISGGRPIKTGLIAMRLGIVTYIIPFLFIYNPALLFIGPAGITVMNIMTGILGVAVISFGLAGYLIKRATLIERFLLIGGGFLLMMPIRERWGLIIGGIVLSAVTYLWHTKSAGGASVSEWFGGLR